MKHGKFFLLMGLTLGLAWRMQAQLVVVLHTSKGATFNAKALTVGQKLNPTDKLNLADKDAVVVGWQENVGLVMLQPKVLPDKKLQNAGTVAEFQAPVVGATPSVEVGRMRNLEDLKQHFNQRNYLILGKTWLLTEPKSAITSADTMLFFKFDDTRNQTMLSRKLDRKADTIMIDPASFLIVNGMAIKKEDARNYRVFWICPKNKKFGEVCAFKMALPDEAPVKQEVQALLGLQGSSTLSTKDLLTRVENFLGAAYGVPDRHNLVAWLKQQFPKSFGSL
jgi:hypothetical protein